MVECKEVGDEVLDGFLMGLVAGLVHARALPLPMDLAAVDDCHRTSLGPSLRGNRFSCFPINRLSGACRFSLSMSFVWSIGFALESLLMKRRGKINLTEHQLLLYTPSAISGFVVSSISSSLSCCSTPSYFARSRPPNTQDFHNNLSSLSIPSDTQDHQEKPTPPPPYNHCRFPK